MIGLAAIAAVTAMAFMGVSSAMAEHGTLCTQPAPEACNPPSTVHYEDPGARLLNPLVPGLECEALVSGNVDNGGLGAPIVISNVTLKYTNCSDNCTASQVKGGTIDVLKSGVELAVVTGLGPEVLVNCALVFHCVYGAEGLTGHGLGPAFGNATGHVTFENAVVKQTGGLLCPKEAKLDALFESLTAVYIR
jgi:hypothetical protein